MAHTKNIPRIPDRRTNRPESIISLSCNVACGREAPVKRRTPLQGNMYLCLCVSLGPELPEGLGDLNSKRTGYAPRRGRRTREITKYKKTQIQTCNNTNMCVFLRGILGCTLFGTLAAGTASQHFPIFGLNSFCVLFWPVQAPGTSVPDPRPTPRPPTVRLFWLGLFWGSWAPPGHPRALM
jgi:hypothetical protein